MKRWSEQWTSQQRFKNNERDTAMQLLLQTVQGCKRRHKPLSPWKWSHFVPLTHWETLTQCPISEDLNPHQNHCGNLIYTKPKKKTHLSWYQPVSRRIFYTGDTAERKCWIHSSPKLTFHLQSCTTSCPWKEYTFKSNVYIKNHQTYKENTLNGGP